MKKIFFAIFVSFFILFSFSSAFAGDCSKEIPKDNTNWEIQDYLKDCAPTGSITSNAYEIKDVKTKIVNITNKLILAGSILSVGGIVFAAILYVTALGNDEKVKKAKSALQFSVIGFVVMLLSFPIVNAIVNLIYGIG
ncbi:MAG: hypothetical protein PHQ95_03565 [Candidatus Gracilibacteria bacterium]|nr:hypothetical protein [Candidatus Gracilibacteria bacterium]